MRIINFDFCSNHDLKQRFLDDSNDNTKMIDFSPPDGQHYILRKPILRKNILRYIKVIIVQCN